MKTVSIADAKNHLSALVRRAEAGEQITLTRRGQPVAQLAAAGHSGTKSHGKSVASTFQALARLRTGISLKGDLKAIARQGLD